MDEVIEAYTNYQPQEDEEKELEFRFKAERTSFVTALRKFLGSELSAQRHATIDVQPATAHGDRLLTRVAFDQLPSNDKPRYAYVTKRRERDFRHSEGWRLAFAVERAVSKNEVDSAGPKVARAKLRFSFSADGWRFDFTIVRQETVEPAALLTKLKEIKSWLVRVYGVGDVEQLASEPRCSFEIEIEHEATRQTLNKAELVGSAMASLARLKRAYSSNGEAGDDLRKLQLLLGMRDARRTSIKQIGSKPTVLLRHAYSRIYPPTGWFLTTKADGFRGFLVVDDGGARIISDHPDRERLVVSEKDSGLRLVVDGELLEDGRFVCHDLLYRDGSRMERPFAARLQELESLREALDGIYSKSLVKEFFRIDDLVRAVQQAKADPGFPTDGHLLISPDHGYYTTKIYKIKPVNTIDFVAVRKARVRGQHEYWLYCSSNSELAARLRLPADENRARLFPDWRPTDRGMPQLFLPPDNPSACVLVSPHDLGERQVVELSRDVEAGRWVLHRTRPDRARLPNYYGNWIVFAMEEWGLMHHPLGLDDLATPSGYFLTSRDSVYDAAVKRNSAIKGRLIDRVLASAHGSTRCVLDLGSGRGQDIARYCAADHVTFVDRDRAALIELVERRYALRDGGRQPDGCSYSFSVLAADLAATERLATTADELRRLAPQSYNVVVCNFAIHYFIESIGATAAFCSFIRQLLSPGGLFMFTCFSDKAVAGLLAKHGGHWRVPLDSARDKYSVRSLGALAPHGAIEVLLPFTGGNLYQERLVDLHALHELLRSHGFKVETGSFADELNADLDSKANALRWPPLADGDAEFVGLYCWTIAKLPLRAARGDRATKKAR